MQINVSITKQKSPSYTNRWTFFIFLGILVLWVINISQFAFIFPMLLNATVVNVYSPAPLEQFTNWLYKQEVAAMVF